VVHTKTPTLQNKFRRLHSSLQFAAKGRNDAGSSLTTVNFKQ